MKDKNGKEFELGCKVMRIMHDHDTCKEITRGGIYEIEGFNGRNSLFLKGIDKSYSCSTGYFEVIDTPKNKFDCGDRIIVNHCGSLGKIRGIWDYGKEHYSVQLDSGEWKDFNGSEIEKIEEEKMERQRFKPGDRVMRLAHYSCGDDEGFMKENHIYTVEKEEYYENLSLVGGVMRYTASAFELKGFKEGDRVKVVAHNNCGGKNHPIGTEFTIDHFNMGKDVAFPAKEEHLKNTFGMYFNDLKLVEENTMNTFSVGDTIKLKKYASYEYPDYDGRTAMIKDIEEFHDEFNCRIVWPNGNTSLAAFDNMTLITTKYREHNLEETKMEAPNTPMEKAAMDRAKATVEEKNLKAKEEAYESSVQLAISLERDARTYRESSDKQMKLVGMKRTDFDTLL